MGHTYTNLLTHIIFSTKDRLPYLQGERRDDVFAYLGGIVRELKGTALNINGAAITCMRLCACRRPWLWQRPSRSSRQIHRAGFINIVSCILGSRGNRDTRRSVRANPMRLSSRYISYQVEHHRKRTFQEELIALLKKSGIEYDERYLWK